MESQNHENGRTERERNIKKGKEKRESEKWYRLKISIASLVLDSYYVKGLTSVSVDAGKYSFFAVKLFALCDYL